MDGPTFDVFYNSLRTEQTKKTYHLLIRKFMRWLGLSHISQLLEVGNGDPRKIETKIIEYIGYSKKEGYSSSEVRNRLAAINHFYAMNDIVLNAKKMSKFVGEHVYVNKLSAYKHEEIEKMLDASDEKTNAMILTYVSTNCRLGALDDRFNKDHHLRFEDLEEVWLPNSDIRVYKLTIYRGSREEYYSFLTPEATKAMDIYLQSRRIKGEIIRPKDPLFRQDFAEQDANADKKFHMTHSGIGREIRLLLIKVGLRARTKYEKHARHEVPMIHGFRKFATTMMAKAKVGLEQRKILSGHSIGVERHYVKYSQEELLLEHAKAWRYLTIRQEGNLKDELKTEIREHNKTKDELKSAKMQEEIFALKMERVNHDVDSLVRAKNLLGILIDRIEKQYPGLVERVLPELSGEAPKSLGDEGTLIQGNANKKKKEED
ncbi:tyrosine-type recombinase/integrase [Nitrososphaera sp. AFS]|uniref:tyrosine-type recombinase/integrase n=1 Tax=Nitrososphaera sp. AFS TaxID=2301191 RepID=UPI0013923650|nr:hypothetical protein [Nitrososphaera sp. AFS]NAL78416.1 hypothetical protein [Nitrososphaera sp. AFS]